MLKVSPNPTDSLGLYLSVPFCRSKCTYCNFASGVYPAKEHERYVDRLIADLASSANLAAQNNLILPNSVDTVYLGGGTPSLLAPELFERLFAGIRQHFTLTADAEITVECAPGQIADETLAAMVNVGVNRVSLGVQSFIDREAQVSGRLHNRQTTLNDLLRLRAAGIQNINLDLIAGLPGQTLASWRESLAVMVETRVPHSSVYMLEVDEDSRLGRELLDGGARYYAELVPSDDAIAQMYEEAITTFAAAGLAQYEISNFAQPGAESKHNLRYWQRRPYLGVGLDASSMLKATQSGDGENWILRSTTSSDLMAYLDGSNEVETAWHGPTQQLEEAWFLGLRLNRGVSISAMTSEFGTQALAPGLAVANRLAADGLLQIVSDRVTLTDRGRFISNDVFAEFLGLAAPETNASPSFSPNPSLINA